VTPRPYDVKRLDELDRFEGAFTTIPVRIPLGIGSFGVNAYAAAEAGGEVIGIVPSTEPADANPHVTHVVAAGIGDARNLAVVASGEAVIALGGEWGTLAEIAYARRLARPVVVLRGWSVSGSGAMEGGPGIERAQTATEAVAIALRDRG
jgi:uncharacterized protein (TIGR00725 family)